MKIKCPDCGKSAQAPAEDAGLMAVCAACGRPHQIPVPVARVDPPAAAAKAEVSSAAQSNHEFQVLWIGIGAAACAAMVLVALAINDWQGRRLGAALAARNPIDAANAAVRSVATSRPINPARAKYLQLDRLLASQRVIVAKQPTAEEPDDRRMAPPIPASATVPGKASAPVPTTRPAAIDSGAVASAAEPIHAAAPVPPSERTTTAPAPQRAEGSPVFARPPVHPMLESNSGLTDEQIGAAIKRGVDHLFDQFDPRTHVLPGAIDPNSEARGADMLCVYALMQCGEAIDDPRIGEHAQPMKDMIRAMKILPLDHYHWETYARGIRATALALFDRPEDRPVLAADATLLVKGADKGAYTYTLGRHGEGWDNSNSQYGLLGVWSAAELGFEVPDAYWLAVQRHWIQTQLPNGQWDYSDGAGPGTQSMTCAGMASLFVTHDYLDPPGFGANVGRQPFNPPLWKGLAWLEQGTHCLELSHGGYSLYGLERVGLACGFKYFGKNDWFRVLAQQSIDGQQADGSWGSNVETAYNLLFLSRGRHPILMNKLRFDGFWDNRPRDVANLARFTGHQLERPLNWQIVPIDHNWNDWMDSPILYLASHQALKLSQKDVDNIRSFVENGGLLFTQSDGDSLAFTNFAHDLAARLFPKYEMQTLPASSPLCSAMYKIKPTASLKYVTNGSRILMLHSSTDLTKYWQLRDDKHMPFPFQLGTNLFIYAAGKSDLRNRLVSTVLPRPFRQPRATFKLARLSYVGNWDPEPVAWERFRRWMQLNTGYGLDIVTTPIKDLRPDTAPIAHLTGTAAYDLTAGEVAAIRNYVESGGMLLVDLCGGTGAFDESLQSGLYRKAFPNSPSHVMPSSHPMLNASADGMLDLSHPRLRQFVIDTLGTHAGLPEIIQAGRGHIVYTSMDLTTGLLGTNSWGIMGYQPSYAQEFVRNAILWTLDGQHDDSSMANRQASPTAAAAPR